MSTYFVQNTPQPIEETIATDEKQVAEAEEAQSFLDEIKEAAQNCSNHTDFVYEPTSGLYYDKKTGYYYNAVSLHQLWDPIMRHQK